MGPKHYGTDQNDDQSIMSGPEFEVDGQNGEGAIRVRTEESPGDTMEGDMD